MKQKILCLSLLLSAAFAKAQNGLECVDVEIYYVSNANDALADADGGTLPVGSVTYRIYADMLPGYKFQAAYGVPGHELRLQTSTSFFNNIDRGATSPTYTKTQARGNTIMLDSWFSAGAACVGNYGIMKTADDGVATVANNYVPPVLQNNDVAAGIPLTTQDGLIVGTPEQVTFVGLTTVQLDVFDANNQSGNLLSTDNASWASLNGSTGPDATDNKVLIAQMTTDGVFSFKLNLQIGKPGGGWENYVAENPVDAEILLPCLSYNSSTVGISEKKSSASSFSIYPNPTSDALTLEVKSEDGKSVSLGYRILDLTGKVIAQKELGLISGKYSGRVDVSNLTSGIYFIELSQDGITSHKRIIKN